MYKKICLIGLVCLLTLAVMANTSHAQEQIRGALALDDRTH